MRCKIDCGGCSCHLCAPCYHCVGMHNCDHVWVVKSLGGSPVEPTESVEVCDECGKEIDE